MRPYVEAVEEAALQSFRVLVRHKFGDAGLVKLDAVSSTAIRLHRSMEPSACPQLVVFQTLQDDERPFRAEAAQEVDGPAALETQPQVELCVQVLANGRLLVWRAEERNTEDLSAMAVVYELRAGVASILAGGQRLELTAPCYGRHGPFDPPSFAELAAGLDRYAERMVRKSTCEVLQGVWWDDNRLFLRARPERDMRRSLTQFLRSYFREDVEVRPEQAVDESKPVDIKVTWNRSNRRAIIEVKWMGQSRDPEDGSFRTLYTAARAREGADQLAEYLDRGNAHAAGHVTWGYLVVIDARRAALTPDTQHLSREDAFRFRDADVEYDPEYHTSRNDFERPRRMFAEPKCDLAADGSPT